MAIEVFEIATRIDLKSNAIKVIEDLAKQFEALDKLTKDVQSSLGRVSQELKALGQANTEIKSLGRGVGSIAKAFDKVGKSSADATLGIEKVVDSTRDAASYGRRLSRAYADVADSALAAARATKGLGKPSGGLTPGVGGAAGASPAGRGSRSGHAGLGFGHQLMEAGIGFEMAGRPLLDHATEAMRQAMDVNQLTTRLSADTRLNQADINRALSAAIAATRTSPGTTVESNMQVLLGLRNVTGDINQSIIALPEFSHMLNVLQAVAGRKGLAGAEQQAYAAEKAEEIMGGLISEKVDPRTGEVKRTIDVGMLRGHVDDMLKVAVEENLKVDPKMYLQFAKQARVAGMLISDEFKYFKLPAIMNVLGGQRTGTALNSLLSVVTSAMTPKTYRAWEAAGLAGPPEFTMEPDSRGRMRKKFKPGKLFEIDTLIQDTDQWMRDVEKHQREVGIKMDPREFILSQVKLGQRATVSGYLADVAKMRPDIEKTQANIHATDPAKVLESADQAVNRLTAAWKNLMQAIGAPALGDAISFLDKLTGYLHKLEDLARANPDWARRIVEGVEVAGAALVGAGGLTMAIWALSGPVKLATVLFTALRAVLAGLPAASAVSGAASSAAAGAAGRAALAGAGGSVVARSLGGLPGMGAGVGLPLLGSPGAIAATLLGAGAAAGAMNAPMVDDQGRIVGNWGGAEGEKNVRRFMDSRSSVNLTTPTDSPLHFGTASAPGFNWDFSSWSKRAVGRTSPDIRPVPAYEGGMLGGPIDKAASSLFSMPPAVRQLLGESSGRGAAEIGTEIGSKSAEAVKDRLDPHVIGSEIGNIAAATIRAAISSLQINVDGQQFGRVVDRSRDQQAQRPPTGPSLPDVRLGPLFPAHAS